MANQLAMEMAAGSSSPSSLADSNNSGGSSSESSTCDAANNADLGTDNVTPLSVPLHAERVTTICEQHRHVLTMNGDSIGESSCTSNETLRCSPTITHKAAATATAAAVGNSIDNNDGDDSGIGSKAPFGNSLMKEYDCLDIVKSSTVMTERRTNNACLLHAVSISRKPKVDVACQTDPDEETFPKISQCSRNNNTQLSNNKNTATSSNTDTSSATSSTSSDGTLRLMIQNFKNMADTVRGPSKKIQAVPWRIMVMPRQHVVQKKGTQKCLGFFLQCCPDAYSDSWSCQAAAELRLISQKQGVPHFTRKTNHVYTAKENDWGYSCFMTWADILDESQGYIKDDKVILEVSVKAEPPKNILTHEQFEKKIQDYMRLADIQSSRGLIDKAIEVNLSALKFCKDRDQDCKAELDAQKAKLIEMKLKQSIERIEKGPSVGKNEEENSLNQSALKQAISGASTINKQSNVSKSSSKSNSGGKIRDPNLEKNNLQNRTTTPPPLEKATEIKPVMELNTFENPNEKMQTTPWSLGINRTDANIDEKRNLTMDSNVIETKVDIDERVMRPSERVAKSKGDMEQQKKEKLPNEIETDLTVLSKLAREVDQFQEDRMRVPSLNERCKQIMRKHHELENDAFSSVLRCAAYKMPEGGGEQWETICNEANMQNRRLTESDEESSSSGDMTSDSDVNGNDAHKDTDTPLSKKMKRLRNAMAGGTRDECDSCIQAMLVPSLPTTEEASCQTDFSMLAETRGSKADAAVVNANPGLTNTNANRHYAQPKKQANRKSFRNGAESKLEDVDWRKKKLNELKEVDSSKKEPLLTDNMGDKVEAVSDFSKEGIARFTAQFSNPDPKNFPMFPLYHPAPQQLFGDELSNQQNAGDEAALDFAAANFPHFNDAQLQQVMAALSVIDVNCMNAKRVVDKAAEFMNAIEMRSKSPFLKGCLQKLAILAGDEKAVEANREGRKDAENITIEEHTHAVTEETDDLANMMECPDDQRDYMLNSEVHRIGVFADQAACKNPLMEIVQVEKLNEHTEKIAQRIAMLENDKDTLAKQLITEKERNKKMDQKHTNTVKQLQSQVQSEKDKHEKVMQQLNQKKNEMKKQEKLLKQHEREAEKCREFQEKNETLTREMQELRQKHAEEIRKMQRELQSSQDTRKNMNEEIKGRDSEISELKSQLNERSVALKRSENALCSDRKAYQSNMLTVTERAKKAEISYLEHKLETGIAVLERAYKDAGQRVKDLESELKKLRSGFPAEELKSVILEWKAKREEVCALISNSKNEFTSQIDQIKSGKSLSQLTRISVPKPPPAPKFKIAQYTNHEKSVAGVSTPAIGVIGNNRTSTTPCVGTIGSPIPPISMAPGSPLLPMSKAPAPPTASPMKSPTTSTSITLIGAKPTNSIATTPVEFGSSHSCNIKNVAHGSTGASAATSGLSLSTAWGTPWETPLAMNSINELMNPSRSFGPIGSDYGIGSGNSSNQLSHLPPGLASASNQYGTSQSNGWSNGVNSEWPNTLSSGGSSGMMPSQQSNFVPMHQGSGYQAQQWSGWHGYHSQQPGNTPDVAGGLIDNSRCSSPRRDVILETLKNHFPLVPVDSLKEYANEFIMRNNSANVKPLPISDLINYIGMATSKTQQIWNKGGGMPPMMHQPPPNVMGNTVNVGVDPYQASASRIHPQPVLSHQLMQPQMRDGMES